MIVQCDEVYGWVVCLVVGKCIVWFQKFVVVVCLLYGQDVGQVVCNDWVDGELGYWCVIVEKWQSLMEGFCVLCCFCIMWVYIGICGMVYVFCRFVGRVVLFVFEFFFLVCFELFF